MKTNTNNEQVGREYPCPTCDGQIPNNDTPGAYMGAISRLDNKTEICSNCGTLEALGAFIDAHPIMYVTADGTYGNANEMKTFSTAHWTEEMYEEFNECGDSSRWDLADSFAKAVCPNCEEDCVQAELDKWEMCHDCENQSE